MPALPVLLREADGFGVARGGFPVPGPEGEVGRDREQKGEQPERVGLARHRDQPRQLRPQDLLLAAAGPSLQAEHDRLNRGREPLDLGQRAARLVERHARGGGLPLQHHGDSRDHPHLASDRCRGGFRKHRLGPLGRRRRELELAGGPGQQGGVGVHRGGQGRMGLGNQIGLVPEPPGAVAVEAHAPGHLDEHEAVPAASPQQRIIALGVRLEQGRAAIVGTGERRRQSGSVEPPGSPGCVLAEARGALQRVRGDAVGAPFAGALRGGVEQSRDAVVAAEGRRGEVPGARVGAAVPGQGSMGAAALIRGAAVVGDGFDERVGKADPALADRHRPSRLGTLHGAACDPEVGTRRDHRPELPIGRCGRDDDGGAGIGIERPQPGLECLQERFGSDREVIDRRLPEPLVLAQSGRQLSQRERVARRQLDQRFDDGRGGVGSRRTHHPPSIRVARDPTARAVSARSIRATGRRRSAGPRPAARPGFRPAAERRRRDIRPMIGRASERRRRRPAAPHPRPTR